MAIGQRIEGANTALFADPVLFADKCALLRHGDRLRRGHDGIVDTCQEAEL
jgi:hypothetical protein